MRWVAIALVAGGVAAATQEPTFKTGTRTVAVYATVTGADGRLVPDLPREAFAIYDNNAPQPLTLFANDIQPITVVLLLDRSGSMRENFELVEKAAEQFVGDLLPADKARIGSFSDRIQVDPRDFTSDHDELVHILRTELQEEGPTPLWNAVNVGITALLHVQGRRVVLVFTDGVDNPMNQSPYNVSLKDVMKRAEEQDVMVYAVGLAGVNIPSGGPHAGLRPGRGPAVEKPDEGLPKIAAQTGGGYFELTRASDLGATFSRVADELHHQYALGFTPSLLDGKMHTLDVRVSGPGTSVRARKSYLARPQM